MTSGVAQVGLGHQAGNAGRSRLTRFSGLLPLAAAACIVRLILLVGGEPTAVDTAPEPVEGSVAAGSVSPEADVDPPGLGPGSGPDPVSPEIAVETDAASVAPAAGPAGATAATPPNAPATGASAAADGVLSPKALLAVAAELKGRRELVERRERELETREAALDLVEERLAAQIGRLEGLKRDLEDVLGRISADEQARLDQLVKVYEAMKAKKAASIFDATALDLLLPVVRRMRDAKVAAVIAEMDPAKARLLTAELARAETLPVLGEPSAPPATTPPASGAR